MMRSVVLSGFMATGKSTIGQLVADALGLPFVDTDALLSELDPGKRPTGRIFAEDGEPRFRAREASLILPLLAGGTPRVFAFGGGAVTIPRVRHAALEHAMVVTLTASLETIAARANSAERPNLGLASVVDRLERARDLLALRREAYGECEATLATDDRRPEELAAAVVRLARRDAITMPLGTRSYAIELADGEPAILSRTLDDLDPSSLVVVTDANVAAARGAWLDAGLAAKHRETRIVLSPGEESKTVASVSRIWDAALSAGLDRQAVVLAFGGGVVGDLAGFAASTLLRGVRCVQIATSLLAMVDSSVGGKTGFDHPTGKNLLGAFYQPTRVLLDLEHLTTLPPRERSAGLAEVVKIALVREPALLDRLESDAAAIAAGDRVALREVVRQAVLAKMRVVREDEHETGVRALLNLGHTVGHALEVHGGYSRWLHGEAVAIGTVLELSATERLGFTPAGTAARAAALLARFGLPVTAPDADVRAAWPYVASDKKRARSALKLPVVTGPGAARVEKVELTVLGRALVLERE
jgi:shikimate kinase/3-dehydroquinate synthase